MMSFRDRIAFCLTDLTSRPGRPVTIAVSFTLFFVTAALVTAFGLANGSRCVNGAVCSMIRFPAVCLLVMKHELKAS